MKKLEFVLYINNNIICQRYFTVKDFNPKIINSIEIKDCVDICVEMIQEDLKNKTFEFLYKNYNPWNEQKQDDIIVENIYEVEDLFDFEIKVDEKSIIRKQFTGNVYPQRVRYSVDVRKIIPSLIKEIQETFSSEYFSVEYCGVSL